MCRPIHSSSFVAINETTSQQQQQVQQEESKSSSSNRSVRFALETNICSIPSSLELIDDISERSELWYNPHDLSCIRNDSKLVCEELKLRQQQHTNNNEQSSSSVELSSSNITNQVPIKTKTPVLLAFDSETRGLEGRVCMERQKRRYVTVKFIVTMSLKLKQKLNSNIIVANASQKCTLYATNLAIEEAARDYRRAYDEYDNEMTSDINNNNMNNKRVHDFETTTSSRNVRARVS